MSTEPAPDDLARVDVALMRLRRLWAAPPARSGLRADDGVEMSTVLVVDALARDTGAALGVADVAHRLDVAPSTASRLVERAVAAGVVERRADPDDARRAILYLTEAGQALQRRARAMRAGYLARILRGWPAADVASLADHLDRFAASVTDGPDHPCPPPRATEHP